MNFIRTSTIHEVTVEDRKYQFIIPAGAPLGEAYDVAFKFLPQHFLNQLQDQQRLLQYYYQ